MPNQLDSEEDKDDKRSLFCHNDYEMIFKKILEVILQHCSNILDICKDGCRWYSKANWGENLNYFG